MFDLIDTAITGDQFLLALHDTLIMVAVSLGFGALIGVPLGIVLVVCRPGGIVANPVVHQALNPLINVLRSLPFIILLIVILPFTRLLVGTTIGTAGAIVPLIVFVAPYIARLVESSLLEVDEGILEAADAMGATPLQTVWHFMLPEAAASLILALTTATIGLLGATAMAGTVGGGGIGDRRSPTAISVSTPLPPLTTAPGADCYCPAYSDAGDPPRLAGCVAINRSTAPGLTRLACADRGEGAGYPRNIAVVEPGHADPTAGDQIDAMLLTQNVYLIGAKAGVTEHAALGQQIGKIPPPAGLPAGPSPARRAWR